MSTFRLCRAYQWSFGAISFQWALEIKQILSSSHCWGFKTKDPCQKHKPPALPLTQITEEETHGKWQKKKPNSSPKNKAQTTWPTHITTISDLKKYWSIWNKHLYEFLVMRLWLYQCNYKERAWIWSCQTQTQTAHPQTTHSLFTTIWCKLHTKMARNLPFHFGFM